MTDVNGLESKSCGIASKIAEIREELEEWREMDLMSEASSEISSVFETRRPAHSVDSLKCLAADVPVIVLPALVS